jgi:hypothetical protein
MDGRYLLAAAVCVSVCLPGPLIAQTPGAATAAPEASRGATPAAEPGEIARIEGFRSARWGMTEAEVKAAIRKDFNIAPDKIANEQNLAEKTGVLAVTVPDLIEGAGTARVTYTFGYASKKLIQVNVLWGSSVDPQVPTDKIVAAANQLRQLFLDTGYKPDTIVTNAKMPDGSILVFEGQDADKHATILRLAGTTVTAPPAKGAKETKPVVATALSLSYVLDGRNPDIYRLKKGQF